MYLSVFFLVPNSFIVAPDRSISCPIGVVCTLYSIFPFADLFGSIMVSSADPLMFILTNVTLVSAFL